MRQLLVEWGAMAALACGTVQDPLGVPMPAAAAAAPGVSSSPPAGCLGDSPPEAIAQDARPQDIFATGSEVLWRTGTVLRRLDVASGRASALDASGVIFVRGADSHDVFVVNRDLELRAIDLSSGSSRVLSRVGDWTAAGALPGLLFFARYALDSDYVYVAWPDPPAVSAGADAGTIALTMDVGVLGRVKRDGSRPPERLVGGVDGHYLVSDGYAYWGVAGEGIRRCTLVPGTETEVVWAARGTTYPRLIGVEAGRVYFVRALGPAPASTFSVESVPVAPSGADGAAARPRVHVASMVISTGGSPGQTLLDGTCAYFGGPAGVTRANLENGAVRQLIGGPPPQGAGMALGIRFVASDGHSLYWADHLGDRIVRWSR